MTGTSDFLGYTRRASESDVQRWRDSQDFRASHDGNVARSGHSPQDRPGPAGQATLWTFEAA